MTTTEYAMTYPYENAVDAAGDTVTVATRVESEDGTADVIVLLTLSDPTGVGLTARQARIVARQLLEAAEAADEAAGL